MQSLQSCRTSQRISPQDLGTAKQSCRKPWHQLADEEARVRPSGVEAGAKHGAGQQHGAGQSPEPCPMHSRPEQPCRASGEVQPKWGCHAYSSHALGTPGHVRHAADVASTTACPSCMQPLPALLIQHQPPQRIGSQRSWQVSMLSFMSAKAQVQLKTTKCQSLRHH